MFFDWAQAGSQSSELNFPFCPSASMRDFHEPHPNRYGSMSFSLFNLVSALVLVAAVPFVMKNGQVCASRFGNSLQLCLQCQNRYRLQLRRHGAHQAEKQEGTCNCSETCFSQNSDCRNPLPALRCCTLGPHRPSPTVANAIAQHMHIHTSCQSQTWHDESYSNMSPGSSVCFRLSLPGWQSRQRR